MRAERVTGVTVEHDEVGAGHGEGAAAQREKVYAHFA